MPPVRAIFFDIGDTLVFDDPPLPRRLLQAAHAVGLVIDEAAYYPAAYRLGEDYALGRYLSGVPWDAPDSLYGAVSRIWQALGQPPPGDGDWPALMQALASIPVTRFVHAGAFDLLDALQSRGFVLGAISDWEDTLPALLTELGLRPYFHALAVSATVGVTKPDPRLFQDALRQAAVRPDEGLHVGDWAALDVAGAQAAGMQTLLFDHAGRSPDAPGPRVTTFPALADFLLSLPKEDFRHDRTRYFL